MHLLDTFGGRFQCANPGVWTYMKIIWGQNLSCLTGVYIRRWIIDLNLFSIRVHHWFSSDDQRHPHDHAWNYLTLVLKGGYTDISPEGIKVLKVGRYAYFRAEHRHSVKVNSKGCWTLLFTGPEKRQWGFWVGSKFRRRNKYHFENGVHPCD